MDSLDIRNGDRAQQSPVAFGAGYGSVATLSDEALMAATVGGNSAAFDELHRRYSSHIRNFVRRKIQNDDTVEDVVQEVFIRLYKSAASFDTSRRLRQWLFTIAANEVRRQWARSGRTTKVISTPQLEDEHGEELESLLADSGPGPYELAVAGLISAQLKRAMDALPEFQREALMLRTYCGMSLQEIAAATNSRVPTVSSRLHYAVEKLKGMLAGESLASA